jgi:hypothetical protein
MHSGILLCVFSLAEFAEDPEISRLLSEVPGGLAAWSFSCDYKTDIWYTLRHYEKVDGSGFQGRQGKTETWMLHGV